MSRLPKLWDGDDTACGGESEMASVLWRLRRWAARKLLANDPRTLARYAARLLDGWRFFPLLFSSSVS